MMYYALWLFTVVSVVINSRNLVKTDAFQETLPFLAVIGKWLWPMRIGFTILNLLIWVWIGNHDRLLLTLIIIDTLLGTMLCIYAQMELTTRYVVAVLAHCGEDGMQICEIGPSYRSWNKAIKALMTIEEKDEMYDYFRLEEAQIMPEDMWIEAMDSRNRTADGYDIYDLQTVSKLDLQNSDVPTEFHDEILAKQGRQCECGALIHWNCFRLTMCEHCTTDCNRMEN